MKYNIVPKNLDLGLGPVTAIEIKVNYAIGDETTTLEVRYFNGNAEITTISPKLLPVPNDIMLHWNYDFSQIVVWALNQINAQLA